MRAFFEIAVLGNRAETSWEVHRMPPRDVNLKEGRLGHLSTSSCPPQLRVAWRGRINTSVLAHYTCGIIRKQKGAQRLEVGVCQLDWSMSSQGLSTMALAETEEGWGDVTWGSGSISPTPNFFLHWWLCTCCSLFWPVLPPYSASSCIPSSFRSELKYHFFRDDFPDHPISTTSPLLVSMFW